MATRCNIVISNKVITNEMLNNNEYLCNTELTYQMYHHCDGYPQGVGYELSQMLDEFDKENVSAEELAQWINGKDSAYELESNAINLHGDIEYLYLVHIPTKTTSCIALHLDSGELVVEGFPYLNLKWGNTLAKLEL